MSWSEWKNKELRQAEFLNKIICLSQIILWLKIINFPESGSNDCISHRRVENKWLDQVGHLLIKILKGRGLDHLIYIFILRIILYLDICVNLRYQFSRDLTFLVLNFKSNTKCLSNFTSGARIESSGILDEGDKDNGTKI